MQEDQETQEVEQEVEHESEEAQPSAEPASNESATSDSGGTPIGEGDFNPPPPEEGNG